MTSNSALPPADVNLATDTSSNSGDTEGSGDLNLVELRQLLDGDGLTPAQTRRYMSLLLDKVESVTTALSASQAEARDAYTTAKLAQSNLTMAEANCEMLEEAVRRSNLALGAGHSTSVFDKHRLSSPNILTSVSPPPTAMPRSISNSTFSLPSFRPQHTPTPSTSSQGATSQPQRGGLFSNLLHHHHSAPHPHDSPPALEQPSHLTTSPPLPSLPPHARSISYTPGNSFTSSSAASTGSQLPDTPDMVMLRTTISHLQRDLESAHLDLEKAAKEQSHLQEQKTLLEGEIENLSVSLFEEANHMVAEAEKAKAALQDDLITVTAERDSLASSLSALRVQRFKQQERLLMLESLCKEHDIDIFEETPEVETVSGEVVQNAEREESPSPSAQAASSSSLPTTPSKQETAATQNQAPDGSAELDTGSNEQERRRLDRSDSCSSVEQGDSGVLKGTHLSPAGVSRRSWFRLGSSRSSTPQPAGYGSLINDESSPAAREDEPDEKY